MNAKTIKKLYREYRVPPHIAAHMKKVADFSVALARKINRKTGKHLVKINTVRNAALLHDILKVCDFPLDDPLFEKRKEDAKVWKMLKKKYRGVDHIDAAKLLMEELGEKTLALIIKKHRHSSVADPSLGNRPLTPEEKILYYADKRVLHDKIVDMEYRFKEGRLRYGNKIENGEKEKLIEKKAKELEKELCGLADANPTSIHID